jgi:Tfp pilus assembly protein FimT
VVPAGVRRLDARGGGLVELVVALSLLAILTALAAPSLIGAWRDAALEAAAEELAGAVGHGRLLAIALNAPVCVAVGGGHVRFEAATAGGCGGAVLAAPGAQPIRLAGGALVSAPGPDVVFSPLGAATPAGSYTVTDPASGRTRRVVVAVSGRVSVR